MSVQVLFIYGALAGMLSVCAYLPYIIDTLKKRTQPQRSSWMIWSVLASLAFFAQVSEGATDSLWFAGVQTSGTIVVFLLSIRLGSGGFMNRADFLVLVCAACGLWLWYLTETAIYALVISISISLLGGLLTIRKAYLHPHSETMSTWLISFIASIFAMLSVGSLDIIMLAYPVYLFVLYGAIINAMIMGRMEYRSDVDTIHIMDRHKKAC